MGVVSAGARRRIFKLCLEFGIFPVAVIELGALGFSVVVPGGFLRYFRRVDSHWEYAREPQLFSSSWKRRATVILKVRLSDPETPRQRVLLRLSNRPAPVS